MTARPCVASLAMFAVHRQSMAVLTHEHVSCLLLDAQAAMSFCEDCEDVVSMAMSAVHALLLKHGVDPLRIGRCAIHAAALCDDTLKASTDSPQRRAHLHPTAAHVILGLRCYAGH